MIILDCEQGEREWFEAKCGVPSASNFDKIITTKGKPSKQAEDYMYELAGEQILGFREEGYTNTDMQRGIDLEPEARSLYELIKGVDVKQVGLCYKDELKNFSCSPDGLTEGGLEIKCPKLKTHTRYLDEGKLPTKYFQQVQGSLFITELPWWDFMSYYPGMKPLIVRVYPDEEFFGNLSVLLKQFCVKLIETASRLK